MIPKSGDVVYISKAASVQFSDPFLFRVIRVRNWTTYHGWCWLDGYQLDRNGDAVDRRDIYVMPDGLKPVQLQLAPRARPRNQRSPAPPAGNRGPAAWGEVRPEPGGNRR